MESLHQRSLRCHNPCQSLSLMRTHGLGLEDPLLMMPLTHGLLDHLQQKVERVAGSCSNLDDAVHFLGQAIEAGCVRI